MTEDFVIKSELSSDHWPFLKVKDERVLDIGCGRWTQDQHDEFSPIFFHNQGANFVLGVDICGGSIEYFKDKTKHIDNIDFKLMRITNHMQVIELVKDYNITTLKCDIEGGESGLLNLKPEDIELVKYMAIEYHSQKLRDYFLNIYESWGFKLSLKCNFGKALPELGVLYFTR